MSISTRLAKLERSLIPTQLEPIHMCRFIVDPGKEAKGYLCNGLEILRSFGESLEDLQARCAAAIEWPSGSDSRIFEPRYES
jgi:hypothetical protein